MDDNDGEESRFLEALFICMLRMQSASLKMNPPKDKYSQYFTDLKELFPLSVSTDNHVCKAVRQKSAQMFTISPKIRYREQMEKNSHALGFNGSGSSRKCDIQVNFTGGCTAHCQKFST